MIVRIPCRLDFDSDLIGPLLQSFLHCHLVGDLIDLEILLERLAAFLCRRKRIGLLVICLLRELDHLGGGQRLRLFLQLTLYVVVTGLAIRVRASLLHNGILLRS